MGVRGRRCGDDMGRHLYPFNNQATVRTREHHINAEVPSMKGDPIDRYLQKALAEQREQIANAVAKKIMVKIMQERPSGMPHKLMTLPEWETFIRESIMAVPTSVITDYAKEIAG